MHEGNTTIVHLSAKFTINKCDSSVCQIRLDYVEFDIENAVSHFCFKLTKIYLAICTSRSSL